MNISIDSFGQSAPFCCVWACVCCRLYRETTSHSKWLQKQMKWSLMVVLFHESRYGATSIHAHIIPPTHQPKSTPLMAVMVLWISPAAQVPRENFLFQYIRSVGRFSEANDKSLFPNPFNIYTSVVLTRCRCFSPLVFPFSAVMCVCLFVCRILTQCNVNRVTEYAYTQHTFHPK